MDLIRWVGFGREKKAEAFVDREEEEQLLPRLRACSRRHFLKWR
jgi:hypothetical protein